MNESSSLSDNLPFQRKTLFCLDSFIYKIWGKKIKYNNNENNINFFFCIFSNSYIYKNIITIKSNNSKQIKQIHK